MNLLASLLEARRARWRRRRRCSSTTWRPGAWPTTRLRRRPPRARAARRGHVRRPRSGRGAGGRPRAPGPGPAVGRRRGRARVDGGSGLTARRARRARACFCCSPAGRRGTTGARGVRRTAAVTASGPSRAWRPSLPRCPAGRPDAAHHLLRARRHAELDIPAGVWTNSMVAAARCPGGGAGRLRQARAATSTSVAKVVDALVASLADAGTGAGLGVARATAGAGASVAGAAMARGVLGGAAGCRRRRSRPDDMRRDARSSTKSLLDAAFKPGIWWSGRSRGPDSARRRRRPAHAARGDWGYKDRSNPGRVLRPRWNSAYAASRSNASWRACASSISRPRAGSATSYRSNDARLPGQGWHGRAPPRGPDGGCTVDRGWSSAGPWPWCWTHWPARVDRVALLQVRRRRAHAQQRPRRASSRRHCAKNAGARDAVARQRGLLARNWAMSWPHAVVVGRGHGALRVRLLHGLAGLEQGIKSPGPSLRRRRSRVLVEGASAIR